MMIPYFDHLSNYRILLSLERNVRKNIALNNETLLLHLYVIAIRPCQLIGLQSVSYITWYFTFCLTEYHLNANKNLKEHQ